MTPEFFQMVAGRDEVAFEEALLTGDCPHVFSVDWREEDDAIVEYCAECLGLDSLTAELRGVDLFVIFAGKRRQVPHVQDAADRHITICTLNDVLSPQYEIRYVVISGGSDELDFVALSRADWQALEKANPLAVAENFLDPRKLPNVFTELTENNLPPKARARVQRMDERNSEE